MGLNINTNISSLKTDLQVNKKTSAVDKSFEKLSSGKSINRAADDPAGLAVALELVGNADTSSVAARNISDAVSVSSIADGALDSASQITGRLSELAEQASSGTLSGTQRSALNNEYQALRSELDRISQTTEFNGQKLLSQTSSINIQAGITGNSDSQISLNLPGVSSSSLGLLADISTQDGAKAALDQTKSATQTLAAARGDVGSTVNRLDSAFNTLKVSEEKSREAASRIQDVDVAEETSKLIANQIGQKASLAVKTQANQQPAVALALLN